MVPSPLECSEEGRPIMPDEQRIVIGGVDTHRDAHTAAAIDLAGRLLDTASFPATRSGYEQLLGWLRGLGGVERVGVEGTSSYGAGLARHLAAENMTVIEVLRPKRRARRGHKSDPADAEAAARAVLSGEATGCPKSADGPVEAISNGASTTTATSPNATSGTSPNSRVDKHRSITVFGTHTQAQVVRALAPAAAG